MDNKQLRRDIRKRKVYMTDSLRGYLSKEGKEALHRLEKAGFDRDLGFSMLESLVPDEKLYDLPGDDEEDDDESG